MKFVSLSVSLGLAAALSMGGPASADSVKRPVIVELYTSQGCNSCPPADELLGRLSHRPDIIAMSLPVTYWDMLGWKDTLASDANTKRQKAYAAVMGRGGVYTPQIIVDGVSDVVGSREGDVEAAIARREAEIEVSEARLEAVAAANEARAAARQAADEARIARESLRYVTDADAREARLEALQEAAEARAEAIAAKREFSDTAHPVSPLAIPVNVTETAKAMQIRVAAAADKGEHNATIWLFHLRNTVTVNISAGENDGRTMTYHNVVADLRPVGHWTGDPVAVDVSRAQLGNLPHDAVAVVVQQGGYGRVVGATLLDHPDFQALH